MNFHECAIDDCPAVDNVLAVASVPADPGVMILAGFTYWIVECDILHIGLWLSDCYFFLLSNYRNIEYRISEFKILSYYWISD